MNKPLFFTGLGIFALEVLSVLVYLFMQLEVSGQAALRIVFGSVIVLVNIAAAICMIIGGLTE